MKIQISKSELQQKLSVVSKVISNKNTLPLLVTAMLHEKNGKFFLTATNNECQMTVSVDLTVISGDFKPVCLNPKTLLPALQNLTEQPLNISVADDKSYATQVDYLGGSFTIVSMSAAEFPVIKGIDDNDNIVSFEIESNIIIPCISAASQSIAADELRPVLGCILLDVRDDGVIIVGTNGHQLYKYAHIPGAPFSTGATHILIHGSFVSALDNAFRSSSKVRIKSNSQFTEVVSDDVHFVFRNVEGNFPNYSSVVPQSQPYHITVNVKSFISALKRVSLFANSESHMVKISVSDANTLTLSAEDVDFSKSSQETIEIVESIIPEGFAIGVKDKTLLQHLSTVGTENTRLFFTDPAKPVVTKEDDNTSALTLLLMPMLLA